MQYIGIAARSGLRPNCASSSAARSSASGSLRSSSQTVGASRRQRPLRRMPVAVAFAGHGALAADVEHAHGAQLTGVRDADRHAVLLLHLGVGGGRLQPSELDRRRLLRIAVLAGRPSPSTAALYSVVVRQVLRRHVLGDELVGDAVVGAGAVQVGLHQPLAGDLPFLDGAVHVVNRRFLQLEAPRRDLRARRGGARPARRGRRSCRPPRTAHDHRW